MKVIDVLNRIANGEVVPYRIKYIGKIYEYVEEMKWYLRDDMKCELSNSKKCLNDEVEIIEEDKKIEKIQKIQQRTDTGLFGSMVNDEIKVAEAINKQANYLSDIVSTINEIIDKLNEMEKE